MKSKEVLVNVSEILAPHIVKNDLAKRFIFLQMFTNPKESENFHIMLVGSAASGKTELLKDVHRLHPKSVYVSENTTSAGLVGYAKKNRIVGGSIRKADGGIACVDDLDKISSKARHSLLEILQNGKATLTKWGNTFEIDARANFLVACNPSGGEWIGKINFSQLKFKKPFLTRFHAIVPFKDVPTEEYGTKLARAFKKKEALFKNEERLEVIRNYLEKIQGIESVEINYNIIRLISSFVGDLKEEYDQLCPYISPRQIEGMISLVKGCARLNHRDYCTSEDFKTVSSLYEKLFNNWIPEV